MLAADQACSAAAISPVFTSIAVQNEMLEDDMSESWHARLFLAICSGLFEPCSHTQPAPPEFVL